MRWQAIVLGVVSIIVVGLVSPVPITVAWLFGFGTGVLLVILWHIPSRAA